MRIANFLMAALLAAATSWSVEASPLTAAYEAACARTPDISTLVARRAEIAARARAADAPLPGGPWVTVMHRTDALTHDRGTREYEAEFGIPLWLRGERGATLASALTEDDADLLLGREVPPGRASDVPDGLLRTLRSLIVSLSHRVPPRGSDEPEALSYAISSFCPAGSDGGQRNAKRSTFRSMGASKSYLIR